MEIDRFSRGLRCYVGSELRRSNLAVPSLTACFMIFALRLQPARVATRSFIRADDCSSGLEPASCPYSMWLRLPRRTAARQTSQSAQRDFADFGSVDEATVNVGIGSVSTYAKLEQAHAWHMFGYQGRKNKRCLGGGA